MRSFRSKLQLAFVTLGLVAIGATGWQASSDAATALQQATYERLTAVRETRASELERYFFNLRNQVQALVADESTRLALRQFQGAWDSIPSLGSARLREYYAGLETPAAWIPSSLRAQTLQEAMIVRNPHPRGAKDLLLDADSIGGYGEVHARFHPTFHRYKTAFGFYDLFLISAADARVLYTVMKETDLGASLNDEPFRGSPLARVFRKVLEQPDAEVVMEDYFPYVPSGMAPAAFIAAPVRRAGRVEGVLAIQIAIDEVNNVMAGERRWHEQGLGGSGQVYIIGSDNTLRSDLREAIEDPERYLQDLAGAGIPPATIETVRRNRTAVLSYPVNLSLMQPSQPEEAGTEVGRNTRGELVLRSRAPLEIDGLNWGIVAEFQLREALGPVEDLRTRILTLGLAVALIFFLAAGWLGTSVTRPVLLLANVARRIGKGERGLRIEIHSKDEIGQLAADFNRMSDNLERTTVSKKEMEVLAGRLITAQEDERRRVARELHDDFTQRLAAAAIAAGRLERLSPEKADAIKEGLARLKQEMAEISDQVHALSRRLHPAILEDLGLEAAIAAECRAVFEKDGLIVNTRIEGNLEGVSREAKLALYRITQESLRNMQRHAGADEAELWLRRDETDHRVILEIRDNGVGFDRTQPGWRAGLGLASMEERARLLGGSFRVASEPGKGTSIHVALPDNRSS